VADLNFDSLRNDLERRMDGAVDVLHKDLAGLRTGRASASLLEPVMVDAYGAPTPMNQVGTIGVPEPRMLTVQVWDRSLVKAVEKAILDSGLGLNPASDGQMIRVPIPALNEERRVELTKIASKYAEDARIAVRNVRRHGMDEVKRAEKDNEISSDAHRSYGDQIQELTDLYVATIDESVATKEKEIMQV
jgi:ribosome recycling factor